ncbi:MAG TPA: hypothetical protein VII83_02995, partial [Gaiellaceae bacterium]
HLHARLQTLKGTETLDSRAEQVFPEDLPSRPRRHPPVAFALLYLALRRLVDWAVGPSESDRSKDFGILVLRHQLEVLHRQTP